MSAPSKLTHDQIRFARDVVAKRRDLQRQLDMYPTLDQLAKDLEVSPRYLWDVVNNRARVTIVVINDVA